jgi:hypothetical protein
VRYGIVPSLAHKIAYPFYLLAVIATLVVFVLSWVWDHSLEGTVKPGSQTLANFVLATYGHDNTVIAVPFGVGVAVIVCAFLMPTRLQPRGWFREKGLAKEYRKELEAEFGVDMLFNQKYYYPKLLLALAVWALAIAGVVIELASKSSFVIKAGGLLTLGSLLVGFACSGVMAVRREPVVAVDDAGHILH